MSIADKFKVIVLDLHNTIFDEVIEYSLAIDAAISQFPVDRKQLYEELSSAHKELGSDWDDDVWRMLPSLKNVSDDIIARAIKLRHEKSKELTMDGVYPGAIEALKELKARGKKIYIVSEVAANIGIQALDWLGLGKVIDGLYTYPSRMAAAKLDEVMHKTFPKDGNAHLKKPDPRLLTQVAEDAGVDLGSILYVGDSKFKDGVMARDAGVKFAWAAYGKVVKDEKEFQHCMEILYGVTGWDKETLKLTQESSRSVAVDSLVPDYVLKEGLAELL